MVRLESAVLTLPGPGSESFHRRMALAFLAASPAGLEARTRSPDKHSSARQPNATLP